MVRVSLSLAACVAAALPLVSAQMQIRQASGQAESSSRTRTRTGTGTGSGSTATGVAAIPTPARFTGTLPASISAIVATITPGTVNPPPSYTLPTYYSSGQSNPSISNAPPLPSNPPVANFPPLDKTPLSSFPGSSALIAAVNLNNIPNIPQTQGTAGCSEAGNEANLAAAAANAWWTCGGHTRDTDITNCPDKNTWGLSYDDGPSPYTPTLLEFLQKNNLKTTFFVVGSRAISRPDILLYEYMNGHQLSVHTWSHPHLTTLSNEDIVLELGWTQEVIRQITGVTPNTMRPPYGDIDDRVRAICKAMNLTPIIWTSTGPNENYDTNDWQIGAGIVSAAEVVSNFDKIIANAPQLDSGYIVLAHDLYQQSVELATQVILPQALSSNPKQTLMPIIQCLKKPLGDSYVETNRNLTNGASAATATASGKAAVTGTSGTSSGAAATNSNSPSGASATFGLSHAFAVVGVVLSAVALL